VVSVTHDRDIKSLLGVTENMNRQRLWMERTMGLVLLAYAIGYLAGELLRDLAWGGEALPRRIENWSKPQQPRRHGIGILVYLHYCGCNLP